MKRHSFIALVTAVLWLTCSASAQLPPTDQDVKSALKDAEYALRRFDEVTSRIHFSRWEMPTETLAGVQKGLVLTQQDAREAKGILAKLDGTRKPSSSELLDIMFDLERVGTEMDDLSTQTLEFQDKSTDVTKTSETSELSKDLMRASATALEAMTSVWSVLRKQVAVQEAQLLKCQPTSASHK